MKYIHHVVDLKIKVHYAIQNVNQFQFDKYKFILLKLFHLIPMANRIADTKNDYILLNNILWLQNINFIII